MCSFEPVRAARFRLRGGAAPSAGREDQKTFAPSVPGFCNARNRAVKKFSAAFFQKSSAFLTPIKRNGALDAGFTLLEMLVVIAVMAVILLLVTGFGPPRSHRLEAQAAAQQVAEAMRGARGDAIAQGHAVAFDMPALPAWLAVSVQAPAGGIVFSPDGSSSGGSVVLGDGGQDITVSADWLTGGVRIDAR